VRLSECLRDRQRGTNRDRSLDQLLQRRSAALGSRRQDARRGLCYAGKRGEIGGVIEPRIHLSQAAKLSRNPGPPLFGLEAILAAIDIMKAQLAIIGNDVVDEATEQSLDYILSDVATDIMMKWEVPPQRSKELLMQLGLK